MPRSDDVTSWMKATPVVSDVISMAYSSNDNDNTSRLITHEQKEQ